MSARSCGESTHNDQKRRVNADLCVDHAVTSGAASHQASNSAHSYDFANLHLVLIVFSAVAFATPAEVVVSGCVPVVC